MKRFLIGLAALMLMASALLWATVTNFNEPWATTLDGFAFTQGTCTGTCTSGLGTATGNPADSIFDKLTGGSKSAFAKAEKGSITWETLGVPAGETVNSLVAAIDRHRSGTSCGATVVISGGVCTSAGGSSTSAACTSVSGCLVTDAAVSESTVTTSWATTTGASDNVQGGCSASNTSITLLVWFSESTGTGGTSTCQLDGDNFALTITSSAGGATPFKPSMMLGGVGMHVTTVRLPIH